MGHMHGEWAAQLNHLIRGSVVGHADELSRKQRGAGAYSLRPLGDSRYEQPQVDHVFECQALGDILCRVDALTPILRQIDWGTDKYNKQPMVVQNALAHARDVHNRIDFLALCGGLVNKKKEGAFRRSLHALAAGRDLEQGLEAELVHNFESGVSPFDHDAAVQMARVVAGRLRDMEDRFTDAMRDVPQGAAQGQDAQRRYDELADEVVQLYEKLDLSHHV